MGCARSSDLGGPNRLCLGLDRAQLKRIVLYEVCSSYVHLVSASSIAPCRSAVRTWVCCLSVPRSMSMHHSNFAFRILERTAKQSIASSSPSPSHSHRIIPLHLSPLALKLVLICPAAISPSGSTRHECACIQSNEVLQYFIALSSRIQNFNDVIVDYFVQVTTAEI